MPNTKHTKWPGWMAIVVEDGPRWYANIFHHERQDQIESFLAQGSGEASLISKLQEYGAPKQIQWTPGNGE